MPWTSSAFRWAAVTAAKLLALGAPQVRSAVLAGAASYLLEGEVMDLPEDYPIPDNLPRPFTLRAHAEALANALEGVGNDEDTEKPMSPGAFLVRSMGGNPRVLAAAVRGAVAEQVPVAPLRRSRCRRWCWCLQRFTSGLRTLESPWADPPCPPLRGGHWYLHKSWVLCKLLE